VSETPPQLEETEKAYLAGILDGEGYIGLQKSAVGVHSVRVAVHTTSETLAKWIHNTTKCGKKVQEREQKKWRRQKTFEWRVFGKEADLVLSWVLPYMRVKGQHAILARQYQAMSQERKRACGAEYCELLKALNNRKTWERVVGNPPDAKT
jgi:hypothetical protein